MNYVNCHRLFFDSTSTIANAPHYSDARYQQLSSSLLQQQDEAAVEQTQKHLQATPTTSTPTPASTHYSNSNSKKSDNYGTELRSTKSFSSVDDTKKKKNASSEHVEVFLGGSCNPTTWRADVAIPALKELGISFYNPVRQIEFLYIYIDSYYFRSFCIAASIRLDARSH